jgi:hypothetical protein
MHRRELVLEDKKERNFYFATKEAESWQVFFCHTLDWVVQVLQAINPLAQELEPGLGDGRLCVRV